MKIRTRLYPLALCAVLAFAAPVFADNDPRANEYLNEYFSINVEELPDIKAIANEMNYLGAEIDVNDEIDDYDIVAGGIRLAGMEELALTYGREEAAEKTEEILDEAGFETGDDQDAYLACALDLGLLNLDDADRDGGVLAGFFYRCIETSGLGRRYVGRISDPLFIEELRNAVSSAQLFANEELDKLGEDLVLSGTTTGYSLLYAPQEAHFLADYTLKYGHSDLAHALQLAGLLKREGFDGYVQIEPKVSVYEYLIEWGDPGEPTPTYKVVEVEEGRYLCYATEYDMEIEFDSLEEKERFHELIETYAKKYDDRVDEDGNVTVPLIAGAWWQPLYSSRTEMQNEEFGKMIDNVIYDPTGDYVFHSFCLPEVAASVDEKVKEAAPNLVLGQHEIYVDPAFIRYTTGESHQ